jgi:hypothetical protein
LSLQTSNVWRAYDTCGRRLFVREFKLVDKKVNAAKKLLQRGRRQQD